MRTRSTPIAALTLALAACSRDVTLPPAPTAPRIASMAPASAYAGERLAIVATGLDPVADANLVQFPSAVARGESVSGTTLVVRVPDGAGSGSVTVSASGGTSAPASPFTYRGVGQLRKGAIAGEVPLLHKPYRIVAIDGETFLHSDLLLGVVRYSDPAFVRDLAVSIDGLPWAGAVAWLESDWSARTSQLVRLDVATGVAGPPAGVAFAGDGPIVAMKGPVASPSGHGIAVLRSSDAGVTLALHDADSLVEVQAEKPLLGVVEARGCADAGNGQLACLVRAAAGAPLGLALVTPGTNPAVVSIALLAGDVVQDDPVDREDPICAATTSVSARVAAVALDDGRIALARLDGGSPAVVHLETGSRTPARSLACATIGPHLAVVAAKRGDDLAVAVDAEAGAILWSASVARASRVTVDVAAGAVHVAGEADNRVLVLDAAAGALLARRSFDVLPGRDGAAQGAAWITAGSGFPAALVFAVGSPPGVLELPLAAAPGTFPVYRNRSDAVGVLGPFAPDDPDYRYYFTLRRQGAEQSGTAWDLGADVQLGQDGPKDAYVATSEGLVALDYGPDGWTGAWATSPIPGAVFASIGLLPGNRVFAAVADGGGAATVRAWSAAAAAAGGAAEQSWTAPGAIAGAALLDGVLWAFHADATGAFVATELDDGLAAVRSDPMPEPFDRLLAVSPNGRTFVTWEYQPWSSDTSVVVWAAGASAYARAATVPVQGVVSGVAFDGSGEALYVLTRAPDRVVVVE